ncbi:MAG TPA: M67 family metallopeptidase [Nitrospiria bacterium]|nr:M67 family metallopeptidase [Nitrospiria bacterium]
MPDALSIPKPIFEELLAHARDEAPNEACGILAGRNGSVTHIYRVKNGDPNPEIRYLMDNREQLWVQKNMRHNGLELTAIYHSHPKSEAYPSATDVKLAFYPEAAYLLVSLADPARPVARAFRITNSAVREIGYSLT